MSRVFEGTNDIKVYFRDQWSKEYLAATWEISEGTLLVYYGLRLAAVYHGDWRMEVVR